MITLAKVELSAVQEQLLLALMDKGQATLTELMENNHYSRDWTRQALSTLRFLGYAVRVSKPDAEGIQVGLWSLTAPGIALALASAPD